MNAQQRPRITDREAPRFARNGAPLRSEWRPASLGLAPRFARNGAPLRSEYAIIPHELR